MNVATANLVGITGITRRLVIDGVRSEADARRALADGVPPGVVLGDAGYGIDTDFRLAVSELALVYVLGVQSSLGVWPPGCGPLPPKPWSGKGRPPKLWRRDAEHQPVTAKDLPLALPPSAWQTVSWREGSRGELDGRFPSGHSISSHSSACGSARQ